MIIEAGWDSHVQLVDGRFIERGPRRPDVAGKLRMEVAVMGWLAPQLPLAVPVPVLVQDDPLRIRHELVPGAPVERLGAAAGTALGGFVRALHDIDVAGAVSHGLQAPSDASGMRAHEVARFRTAVMPLLPPDRHAAATALLDAMLQAPTDTVVHGDLGPEHVLADGDRLSGVIDFSDAHVGDPAVDLAWALHTDDPEFNRAFAAAYGPGADVVARSVLWHRLGPWYEVTHGFDLQDRGFVASGLAGVLARL